MSNKRPLSPESTNGHLTTDQRALKRFKLHSIIQELRNEEANLVILKKLRSSQQILSRHPTSTTTTNGHHPTAARVLPSSATPSTVKSGSNVATSSTIPNSMARSSLSSNVNSTATRKPTVPPNVPIPAKVLTSSMKPSSSSSSLSNANSTNYSLEERKAQAKNALRLRLERDLLNIPAPKPLLQDILFVPNPNSLEFQPYVGLEDVVQCLYELQNDRHRLPQRFTDRAQIDEPFVCDHCGTDYTIRWWKHLNTNNSQTNILCDRCKKHVTRRTLKSDHSALLKNVFVSAMEQEKEIEKSFQALIKQQQKNSASATRSSSSSSSTTTATTTKLPTPSSSSSSSRPPAPSPLPSSPLSAYNIPSVNHLPTNSKPKTKSSIPQAQNFATKLSQQPTSQSVNATRKSHVVGTIPTSTKSLMPAQQQSFRSATNVTAQQQQAKQLQMAKMSKNAARQTSATSSSRPNYLPSATPLIPAPLQAAAAAAAAAMLHHPALATGSTHHNVRPTATKRRTLPSVPMK